MNHPHYPAGLLVASLPRQQVVWATRETAIFLSSTSATFHGLEILAQIRLNVNHLPRVG